MTTPPPRSDYTTNTGTGIEIPSLLPSALGSTAASIATGISDASTPDPISVRRRWGTIVAINSDATVDINLGGVLVPHVSYDASYQPALDEVVQLNVVDTDMTVVGPTAQSIYSPYVRRVGTVTNVDASGTAPGWATTVDVQLTDVTPPVTINNVPFNSGYYPTTGDTVWIGQSANSSTYLVLGAVNRTDRRATGTIEPSLLLTPPPNALIMNGQTVSRTTYAALWAWAQLNGLVISGMFTTGNGTSTFGLPDFRGRVPIGAGTGAGDTYDVGELSGAATVTLATNQMPSHDHSVAVAAHATHNHSVSVATHGTHDHSVSLGNANTDHYHSMPMFGSGNEASGYGLTGGGGFVDRVYVWGGTTYTGTASGFYIHNHTVAQSSVSAGSHTVTQTTGGPTTHTVTESTVGGTTPVDVRQPSIGINWIIWV